jgi:hypothetical protein
MVLSGVNDKHILVFSAHHLYRIHTSVLQNDTREVNQHGKGSENHITLAVVHLIEEYRCSIILLYKNAC